MLTLGYGINLVGNIALLLTAVAVGSGMNGVVLAPALILIGFGEGLGMSPLVGAALAGVPQEDAGSASGIIETVMQLGLSFGVAAIGLVFFMLLADRQTIAAYTDAFPKALIISPVLALAALLLVSALSPSSGRRN